MHAFWEKMLYRRMKPVIESIHFPYAHIKGSALSQMAYLHPDARDYTDFDILISKDHVREFEKLLITYGFHPMNNSKEARTFCLTFSHQDVPYLDATENFCVDINFSVLWGEYEGEPIDTNDFLTDAIETEIYGTVLKTLTPLKAFIELCLHTYRDLNSIFLLATRKQMNSAAFQDIYFLLKNQNEIIKPDILLTACEKYNVTQYVYYVLYYTRELYDDSLLDQYCILLRCDKGEKLLPLYGLNDSEGKIWKVDFHTRIHSSNVSSLILEDLTESDIKKIEMNQAIGVWHQQY